MAAPLETVIELERILAQVNAGLNKILPAVTDPAFTNDDVRKAVEELERVSRWRRDRVPDDQSGYAYAKARAEIKAKETGEVVVVAKKDDAEGTLVVVPKARLLKEKPFGLDEKNIIYETIK